MSDLEIRNLSAYHSLNEARCDRVAGHLSEGPEGCELDPEEHGSPDEYLQIHSKRTRSVAE